jgi:Protein of unknown function (DUF2723)
VILAALAFVWFLWQCPPGVDWLDAGELAAAGFGLGVSHPPGQPLHALLGRLAASLPLGEVSFRVAVLSALAAALTVAGSHALAKTLVPRARLAAWVAPVLVVASPLLLGQAARAEVYAPLAALTTWGAVLAVRWLRDRAPGDGLAAALLFTLGAGLQPLSALAVALPLAVAIAVRAPRSLVARAAGFAVLGLVVYAYLPLRWWAEPATSVLWGDRRGFLTFVSGTAYAQNFDGSGFAERVFAHLMLLTEGPGLALVIAGGAGLLFALATGLRGAGALLGTVPLVCATGAVQRVFHAANPDIHGYLLPAVPLLAAGVTALLAAAERALLAVRAAPALVPIPGLAFVGFLAAAGPRVAVGELGPRDRDDALAYTDETAFRLPPGPALYLTTSDHAFFPALYEQSVAGARPDVAVAGDTLLASSWHLAALARARPELRYSPRVDDTVRAAPIAGGELPRPGFPASPLGWGYRYADVPAAPSPPPRFQGELGWRIAAFVRLDRGALWRELPRRTPVFIFEPWQLELVWRDLLPDARTPVRPGAPFEVHLLAAWHRALAGDLGGLDGLGDDALVATAQMLVRRDRLDEALLVLARSRAEGPVLLEATIRARRGEVEAAVALLERFPDSPRALAHLGLLHAQRGELTAARTLWQRSIALDPDQPDVRAWLERLTSSPVTSP